MIKLHLLALSCGLLALAWCIMAREPLHAALAADLERLGHDAAAPGCGPHKTAVRFSGSGKRTLKTSVGDLCAFWGPGRTHLCAVGKPVCGFWGLEERTGAFVRAFLGTWKKALHRAFMQCGGRPVCILGAWKNADWG